jgi:transposase-like protein
MMPAIFMRLCVIENFMLTLQKKRNGKSNQLFYGLAGSADRSVQSSFNGRYYFGHGLNPLKKLIFAEKKMKHTQIISCPHCSSTDLVKNGHSENGSQRWRCNRRHKSFQLNYRCNARKQGVKEQISELTLNSSGVRDISRILKISKNTVISEFKKKLRT